jgi:periplasmic divalent cation tolerance protein
MTMTDFLQVATTTADRDTAANLARSAVAARLAASAQVSGPVMSFFWHLDEQGEGEEWQVTLKTTAERFPELEAHLRREHPWDNPEVTALPLAAASEDYLAWLRRTVSPEQ